MTKTAAGLSGIQIRPMNSFVISRRAVTLWMAQRSSLSRNQTVYRWSQIDLDSLRYNPTVRKQYPLPQPKTKAQGVATSTNKAIVQTLPERIDHSRCRRIRCRCHKGTFS